MVKRRSCEELITPCLVSIFRVALGKCGCGSRRRITRGARSSARSLSFSPRRWLALGCLSTITAESHRRSEERLSPNDYMRLAGAIVIAVCTSASARAQADTTTRVEQASSSTVRVGRAGCSLRLDALLTEPCWVDADSITNFRQREPLEGAPSSERTVVKVVRDDEALYV